MIILGITASSDKNTPNAPTSVVATDVGTARAYNNGAASVAFVAPTYTGGSPIVSYTVTSNTGGFTATGASSPLTVTGLQSSSSYTFTVTATNANGFTSAASVASASITATTVPQAPTIGTATDGGNGTSASVAFTAGATGGKTITTFTATSSPGSITGTGASSPVTVSGLTTGTAYTFTVTATNANGTSTASSASNSVTPATPSNYESIASFTGNGSTTSINFSSIPQTYKYLVVRGVVFPNSNSNMAYTLNNVTGSNYQQVRFYSNSTSIPTGTTYSSLNSFYLLGNFNNAISPTYGGSFIVDFYDYANATKAPQTRAQWQMPQTNSGPGESCIISGSMTTAQAVSSIQINNQGVAFSAGTVISLYGVKG
jgi:hypothetical protein